MPGTGATNRDAAIMVEQRRLRRQLESSLREQLLNNTATTEDTIVCQLCELLWADHACLWMLPSGPEEAHDWSRQTIVSEAVADYYPLVGYSTSTPPEEWAKACLEPTLEADGAVCHSGEPFNAPKEGESDSSSLSRYLTITLRRKCPDIAGCSCSNATVRRRPRRPPWTDFDRELLEDSASILGIVAGKQPPFRAIGRAGELILTNMLNSLDVAVMVIEQPPGVLCRPLSPLVNRSFCELFRLERAQVETNSYLHFMDLVRPLLPDWNATTGHHRRPARRPHRRTHRRDHARCPTCPTLCRTHLHRFATPARDASRTDLRADVLFPGHHLR